MHEEIEVKGSVAGIRHNLPNGEADYPEFAKRVPVGSYVYLEVVPKGEKYSGSVRILDSEGEPIGSMGKSDRQFFKLDIPEDSTLPVKVIEHAFDDNAIVVWHINKNGFEEIPPYEIENKYDEPRIDFCKEDEELCTLTKIMLTLVRKYTEGEAMTEAGLKELCKIGDKYAQVCDASIDGSTLFSRAEIKTRLEKLCKKHDVLHPIFRSIFEIYKDMSKKDYQTKIYREQWERVRKKALQKNDKGKSFLDEYEENLKFQNLILPGSPLTEDVIRKEIARLTQLLSDSTQNKYQPLIQDDSKIAHHLYSWVYSLQSMYLFFMWRIKLNYMYNLLGVETQQVAEKEEEDMFRYIHHNVTKLDEKREVTQRVKNIVKGNVIDICNQLKELQDTRLITMPSNITEAKAELVRMGMPSDETHGYSYKNFAKEYREAGLRPATAQ